MVSLLDIIGPVMVGPSSSHTAGACRLGLLARCLVGGTPQSGVLQLHGSFARTGEGHGTDKALVGGLLGFRPDDERLRDALQIADGYGRVNGREMWLEGVHIAPYTHAVGYGAHDPDRARKLLLHAGEIARLKARMAQSR